MNCIDTQNTQMGAQITQKRRACLKSRMSLQLPKKHERLDFEINPGARMIAVICVICAPICVICVPMQFISQSSVRNRVVHFLTSEVP